jgi:hypothetical protein
LATFGARQTEMRLLFTARRLTLERWAARNCGWKSSADPNPTFQRIGFYRDDNNQTK